MRSADRAMQIGPVEIQLLTDYIFLLQLYTVEEAHVSR